MTSTRATILEKENGNTDYGKVINDAFYGPMYFPPLLIAIMDTPEFQRLRDIKQLGGNCYIYPTGTHTRFDHALGTCHITGLVLKILKERNSDIQDLLTDKWILSLEIAALCHDLGVGPFSRVYQDQFLSKIRGENWDSNENSVKVFEMIVQKKRDVFEKYGIDEGNIKSIKYVIKGEVPASDVQNRFRYEIVKNRRNGIDCNTFDKILRDCYFVGVKSSFNYMRIVESAMIIQVKGEYRLCLRYKEQLGVSALFDSSWALQSLVYTHKTTRAVEMMLAEAMDKADRHFELFEARNNPEKLLKLSDCIFYKILHSDDNGDTGMAAAKAILQRINERKLYQFCGQTCAVPKNQPSETEDDKRARSDTLDHDTALARINEDRKRQNAQCEIVKRGILSGGKIKLGLDEDDIRVEVIKIFYGKGRGDPLDAINFINKQGKLVKRTATTACRGSRGAQSNSFCDEYIRVYSRDADKDKKREITNRFYKWCLSNSYDVPEDMEKVPVENEHIVEATESNGEGGATSG